MNLRRSAEAEVRRALETFRIVLLAGPRQSGKTTLARLVGGGDRDFLSLDDLAVLDSARRDPEAFVAGLGKVVTLDEVQRAPRLLLALKRAVDEDPRPGRFLLTGSADPISLQEVRETLAGRLGVVRLRPLTAAELEGRPSWNPLDLLEECASAAEVIDAFRAPRSRPIELDRRVPAGGFPEPAHRLNEDRRRDWHEQYARTYLERDLPPFLRPGDALTFLRFVRLVAGSTAGLLNNAHLARDAGVSHDTSRRWLGILHSTYLADLLPPFHRNVRKRLIKAPKLHISDSGLAWHLLGIRDWEQAGTLGLAGALAETWVHAQLQAFAASARTRTDLHHFRSVSGEECDFVVETGRLVPIEVKSGRAIGVRDAAGLSAFLQLFPRQAPLGILLHAGPELLPLGDRVAAVPMSTFLAGK